MINLDKNTVSFNLFRRVLREIKNSSRTDIIDSFSDNQFKSKFQLTKMLFENDIITRKTQCLVFGSWYGSLLIPMLSPYVEKIIMVDLDDEAVRIGKNKFFYDCDNVSWSTGDVFTKWRGDYPDCDLVINTSCEHMPNMREWPFWDNIKKPVYFAFQSNNMFDIDTHVNCTGTLDEFKKQLPVNCNIIAEHKLQEDRGTRFTIIGKLG